MYKVTFTGDTLKAAAQMAKAWLEAMQQAQRADTEISLATYAINALDRRKELSALSRGHTRMQAAFAAGQSALLAAKELEPDRTADPAIEEAYQRAMSSGRSATEIAEKIAAILRSA